MIRVMLLCGFYFSLNLCFSQTDSIIYFDLNWKETTIDNAMYYRETGRDGIFWHIKDYYLSGNLQMEGRYSSFNPDIREGYFIWYYENGQKYSEGNFKHGKREGLWTYWFPDGLKKQEVSFSRNDMSIKWRSKRLKMTGRIHERAEKMKRRKRYAEAIGYLNSAIEINSFDEWAYFERAKLFILINKRDNACDDFHKAREYMYYDTFEVNEMIVTYCK